MTYTIHPLALALALETSSEPRMPSPESLALALETLGLGAWEVHSAFTGIIYARIVRGELEVALRLSPFRQGRSYALQLALDINGPGFRGCDLGANNDGRGLRRILPPIPWTDAAASDVLRTLERFKLPALVAALEVTP